MAMLESASNFIISAQLMIDKPYEVGDKIQMDLLIGTVVEIGFLSTKIRTGSEHLVIVPNKMMATSIVTNFAKGGPSDTEFLFDTFISNELKSSKKCPMLMVDRALDG